jgi:hypothetical protein
MSLELLNTLGTLTTVAIVAATAIAALVQLRHLRAGNQINAMLTIGDRFNGQMFWAAVDIVNDRLDGALEDPAFREYHIAFNSQSVTASRLQRLPRTAARCLACRKYEQLGILIKNRIVDGKVFLDQYSGVVARRWHNLENYTALTRAARGSDAIWENFEYLAVISEEFLHEHPSSYPRGLRRMQLTNPWPIAAPATS